MTPTFYYFALAPFKFAKIAFIFLKPLSYATWPFLLAALTGKGPINTTALAAAVLGCIAMCPTVYEETIVGNINVFLLTALFAAGVLAIRGHVYVAATITTAIAVCKPQYSLFWIPLFFLNPGRAVAGGFTGLGVLLAHTLLFMTPTELMSMLQRWLPLITNPIAGTSDVNNMSTSGVFERLLTPMSLSQSGSLQGINLLQLPTTISSLLAKIAAGLFSLIAAAAIWPSAKTIRQDNDSFAVWVAAITLITLFVTPVIWLTHYMLMVIPVFMLIYKLLERKQLPAAACVFAIVSYAIFSAGQFLNSSDSLRVTARAFGWPFLALMAVFCCFVWNQASLLVNSKSKRTAS